LFTDTYNRLSSGGAAVAWVRMPDTVAARNTPNGSPSPQDLQTTAHLRELIDRYVSAQPSATAIDLAGFVCPEIPCPKQRDGLTLRPTDGLHFDTPDGARYVAEYMSDQVTQMDLNQIAKP